MFNALFGNKNDKKAVVTQEELDNFKGQLQAINKSQAVIEFDLDGNILEANENFLRTVGYSRDEVVGNHHSMFVDSQTRSSRTYAEFWASLKRGEFQAKEYRRLGKGNREIWLSASYNPIYNGEGQPYKVVKYATDITEQKNRNADYRGKIDAIGRSQAVIEFDMTGRVITANDNFLTVMGYSLSEVQGQHHSMFMPPADMQGREYQEFWAALNRGEFQAADYLRHAKGGREVWIHATYTPILDADGKPVRVVKFATDITETKKMQNTVNTLVEDVTRVMSALSRGDLTEKIDGHYDGQLEKLKLDINETVDRLTDVAQRIRRSASTVSETAGEMSQSNSNLSVRTEQQAFSLEQTSASMEQMTGTVQANAENAREASSLALEARHQAEKGGEVVRTAVTAMSDINEASRKISDIIGVIDEIAFQTNLLALNASVEAARAGEQGRGFSVVASEVRNLAGRSATAAKEIKELIQDSVDKVDNGSSLVNESGVVLDEIVTGVQKVAAIVEKISNASQEQADGIGQVNQAIITMDEATQQNAALVEETAAVSETARQESENLVELVSFFTVGGEGGAALGGFTAGRRSRAQAAPASNATRRAAVPPKATTEQASGYQGAERRSAERPWSGKRNSSAGSESSAEQAPVQERKFTSKVANSDMDSWTEF